MSKTNWTLHVPGYPPFSMVGAAMDYDEALATAQSIWPQAEIA